MWKLNIKIETAQENWKAWAEYESSWIEVKGMWELQQNENLNSWVDRVAWQLDIWDFPEGEYNFWVMFGDKMSRVRVKRVWEAKATA